MPSAESSSSSTSAFVSALILYGIVGSVLFIAFSVLRPKQPQVYQPKSTDLPTLSKDERPLEVSKGPYSWFTEIWTKPQTFFIQYIGLDGYLYTRYLGIFAGVSLAGCLMLLPILLPVNATNGSNYKGFELLSFANVTNNKRYYAHVFLSWFFFGTVIFVIYKELVFYTSLRHAVQTTPLYDGVLSSRTLLLTDIPDNLLIEEELRRLFPVSSRIWYARDNKELDKLIEERDKLTKKYEAALNKVVKKSTKYHKKLVKKNLDIPLTPQGLIEKQPTHRLGKIPFIGEKVETINYALKTLPELNDKITDLQDNPDSQKQVGSVFIEFPNQLEAQRAYQSIPFHGIFRGERVIGVAPEDVIWSNLSLTKHSRMVKRVLANTFLTLLIIFWAIPVAVVGCISNITFLTSKVHFLKFINNCPSVILGLITGILPTVALAVLMSLVPVIIKKIGKISGFPTKQQLDQYVQSWYFGFQVIQVFLVVTLASSASSTVTAIIDDPSSAMTLLAANLPKASNFYIAYFLLQGLYTPAWTILQAVPLALSHALSFLLNTPRKKWNKMNTLSAPSFGVIYPGVQLLIVLFIVYAIIAPVLLIFSTFALALSYIVNLYIFTYVKGPGEFDARGRNYPKALLQSFVALYLAEICVLGLFIMAKTWGPVALEGIMLAVTVLAHVYLKYKFVPLYDIVPISGIHEARGDGKGVYPMDHGFKEIKEVGEKYVADIANGTSAPKSSTIDDAATYESNKEGALNNKVESSNALNDSSSSKNETITQGGPTPEQAEVNQEADIEKLAQKAKTNPKSVLKRLISPENGYTFTFIRSRLPVVFNRSPNYSADFLQGAYNNPNMNKEDEEVWIPKDAHGVSTYEIELAQGKARVYDDNAYLSEDGKLTVDGLPPYFNNDIKV